MRTLKTSLKTLMAGLVVIAILIILNDNGYSYFGFIEFLESLLEF